MTPILVVFCFLFLLGVAVATPAQVLRRLPAVKEDTRELLGYPERTTVVREERNIVGRYPGPSVSSRETRVIEPIPGGVRESTTVVRRNPNIYNPGFGYDDRVIVPGSGFGSSTHIDETIRGRHGFVETSRTSVGYDPYHHHHHNHFRRLHEVPMPYGYPQHQGGYPSHGVYPPAPYGRPPYPPTYHRSPYGVDHMGPSYGYSRPLPYEVGYPQYGYEHYHHEPYYPRGHM